MKLYNSLVDAERMFSMFNGVFMQIMKNKYGNIDDIAYTIKREGNNSGQFGYYFNSQIEPLLKIIDKYTITSIADLGAGYGLTSFILKNSGIASIGYEIEDRYVEFSKFLCEDMVIKKDILTLKRDDIKRYGAVYFWEPLYLRELAEKFVNNLVEIMYKGQYIIYRPSGSIGEFLSAVACLKRLKQTDLPWSGMYQVYIKKN
jgi:hypothetical protein